MKLEASKDYSFNAVLEQLFALNYTRVDIVVDRGDIAVRGGIIDIFTVEQANPLRLEFFGNTLESIRTFNVSDQRSLAELRSLVVPAVPAKHQQLERTDDFFEAQDHFLPDFTPGDYVVHENYGIAYYEGLTYQTLGSVAGEYFTLRFARNDAIYVPIEQANLVHAYRGSERAPTLSQLSDNSWEKAKQKATAAAKNIAFDLFNLYRQRTLTTGFAFPEDSPSQTEMEKLFPYTPTIDQAQAIDAVKQDMHKPVPMDRLVCGEVGFGKTEIAIRAAFRAALAGKQVAVVAPTTILVNQHYHTLQKRFAHFGVQVRMLSRFNTDGHNRQIIKQLKAGTIDVVVGTHRLLQKDVGFKALGLLIIDEEQRFGVEHKEFLKKLFVGVDILTLSATPLPRTLYMSLSGIRDISVLETAPSQRHPIRTILTEYREATIKKALQQELARQGQIYVLSNDIKSLLPLKRQLEELSPGIRVATAHGQMPKHALEDVISDFIDKKYDVLVCTTIIENGIDISNVNTIIVNNADHFGLAQLHQIRGRVGRSTVKAYAYLLYRSDKILSTEALARLHTLKEFTMLGAGYRIALRDLEIRGAGNVLGAQQSGHVQSIGFTLFTRLLEESVKELKGDKIEKKQLFHLPSNQENYIPSEYLAEEHLRVSLYQRIMEAIDVAELEEIEQEMHDRFGRIPSASQNLIANIKLQLERRQKREKKIVPVGRARKYYGSK